MKSVLVVVTRQIGDVLLTTPLIHAAKQLWPDAGVDVLGFKGTLGMLAGSADIREAIETPPRLGFGGTLSLAKRLWKRYDLALVADVGDRAHIIGAVAARTRAGILPPDNPSNWWKKRLLAHAVQSAGDLGEVHVVEEKLGLLQPWSRGEDLPARLVPPKAIALPASLAEKLAPRFVVVHAPSMWPYKQWPPTHFADLIARLRRAGHQVVLTGGPSKEDRALVASLASQGAIDAGNLDFGQLTTLLKGAALYIGPDTSISHLAAACDTPVLAIFGPTNPMRWSPWPTAGGVPMRFVRRAEVQAVGNVSLLQAPIDSGLPCVPCGKAGCEDHRQSRADCLPAIMPARVAAEALRKLGSAA